MDATSVTRTRGGEGHIAIRKYEYQDVRVANFLLWLRGLAKDFYIQTPISPYYLLSRGVLTKRVMTVRQTGNRKR